MTSTKNIVTAALLGLIAQTDAAIKTTGIWTGHDVTENSTSNIGVANGVPYSTDSATQTRIAAGTPLDGTITNYTDKDNVKRIKKVMTKSDFEDTLFPMRNAMYTHTGFLKAAAKYPHFCGEDNLSDYTADEACELELATLFAHFAQESGAHDPNHADYDEWRQGLYHVHEHGCGAGEDHAGSAHCDYRQSWGWPSTSYPLQGTTQYYGRGPFQLSWNYNLGEFSETVGTSKYDSKLTLLKNPSLVETDKTMIFQAALWFYMTPQSPKPSMHEVVTGYFSPSASDTAAGIGTGFGTTINIINGAKECHGKTTEDARAANRISFYDSLLEHFDLDDKSDQTSTSKSCKDMEAFPTDSAGKVYSYFVKDTWWKGDNKCRAVNYASEYSVYTLGDYKRCVCDSWGNGKSDCGQ